MPRLPRGKKKQRRSLKSRYRFSPNPLLIIALVFLLLIVIPSILVPDRYLFEPPSSIQPNYVEPSLRVLDHRTGQVHNLLLEDYVVGVVGAEMPASFEMEALKAQAVCARTYACKRIEMYALTPNPAHPTADVCSNPNHCQAWKSEVELQRTWGLLQNTRNLRKVTEAVKSTHGQVLTWNGALIDPVYHSTCGGRTENSEDVWALKIPYLRSVSCNCREQAPRYEARASLSWDEVEKHLQIPIALPVTAELDTSRKSQNLIQPGQKSPTGRLKTIEVTGHSLAASEFRQRLGLNSTWLTWETNSQGITFQTRGFGHGVGLCQYGANQMASEGKKYHEILKYYYQGVEILSGSR